MSLLSPVKKIKAAYDRGVDNVVCANIAARANDAIKHKVDTKAELAKTNAKIAELESQLFELYASQAKSKYIIELCDEDITAAKKRGLIDDE